MYLRSSCIKVKRCGKKLNSVLVLLLGFSSMLLYSQKKETFKDSYTHFLITYRDVVTQKYADSVSELQHRKNTKWEGQMAPLTPPPAVPSLAVYDHNIDIHFKITPQWYVSYRISEATYNDTIIKTEISDIKKINRSTMMVTKFSTVNFDTRITPLYYENENIYKIVKVNNNDIREICGYRCYRITLKNTRFPNQKVELYVTEEIDLNYHPLFNYKSLLQKYYPLYAKVYDINFPNDVYKEFLFHEL